ncbi:MAG: radical SAM protein [Verrucomicrobiota bacterium]|jgi:putative pyruvate formate lyase activating enzyme|nr:radical SAM protein [Verrucomicrobiota bacterium]
MASSTSSAFSSCRLCPHECGVNRLAGETGVCGETVELRLATAGAHFGEEPCFTGTHGSGALFFSGCPCHCFFCQNWQISNLGGKGTLVSLEACRRVTHDLLKQKVHNLNFVTPDHVWPHIEALCRRLREDGVEAPFLFNSSGYHLPAMVPRYAEWMDVFVPDFKFADPKLAQQVMRDGRYPDLALEAIRRMVEAKGFLAPFDPEGTALARQGVLVRHLVLPGHLDNSLAVLSLLREEFGRFLPLSLMSQYTPIPALNPSAPFDQFLSPEDYQTAVAHALSLGFENLLIQPPSTAEDFLPDFTRPQPFRGNLR